MHSLQAAGHFLRARACLNSPSTASALVEIKVECDKEEEEKRKSFIDPAVGTFVELQLKKLHRAETII